MLIYQLIYQDRVTRIQSTIFYKSFFFIFINISKIGIKKSKLKFYIPSLKISTCWSKELAFLHSSTSQNFIPRLGKGLHPNFIFEPPPPPLKNFKPLPRGIALHFIFYILQNFNFGKNIETKFSSIVARSHGWPPIPSN